MNCMTYGCISILDYIWNGISEDGVSGGKSIDEIDMYSYVYLALHTFFILSL